MFLQNNTKIRCFLPSVWATETPEKAAEKNGKKKKKKKKSGQPLKGIPSEDGMPQI